MSACSVATVINGSWRLAFKHWRSVTCGFTPGEYRLAKCRRVEPFTHHADEDGPDEFETIECAHRFDESRELPVCASRGRFVGGVWRSA